jgi:hypothetical protein
LRLFFVVAGGAFAFTAANVIIPLTGVEAGASRFAAKAARPTVFFLAGAANALARARSHVLPHAGSVAVLRLHPARPAFHLALVTGTARAIFWRVALAPRAHHALLNASRAGAVARALRADAHGGVIVVAVAAGRDAVAILVDHRIDAFALSTQLFVRTAARAVRAAVGIGVDAAVARGARFTTHARRRFAGRASRSRAAHRARRDGSRNDREIVDAADDLAAHQRPNHEQPGT